MAEGATQLTPNNLEQLKQQFWEDIEDDILDFLGHASTAAFEADGNMHASCTTTLTIKKKVSSGDEVSLEMQVNTRERMPKAVIKRDLGFKGEQLVLL